MSDADNSRDPNPENLGATEPRARQPLRRDDTATTEQVKVEPNPDAPFALPHVSELDEVTPRDARREAGKQVTLPAYNQIAQEPRPDRTTRNRPAPLSLGAWRGRRTLPGAALALGSDAAAGPPRISCARAARRRTKRAHARGRHPAP